MNSLAIGARPEAGQSISSESLRALARFVDTKGQALSFYFRLASADDNSHRREVVMIKDLVRGIAARFPRETHPEGLLQDLDALLAVTGEIRETPSRMKAIFACRDQGVWYEFNLPALTAANHLEAARRFDLAPLVAAIESSGPCAVVLIERGKARGFEARGTDIEEVEGFFEVRDLSTHEADARTGWSRRVDNNTLEKSRASGRNMSHEIERFLALRGCSRLVIGCRDDLWGEFMPFFEGPVGAAVIGRFHLPNFDIAPAETLRHAAPVFEDFLRRRRDGLAREIKENPARRSAGLEQVLRHLREGRVQKLLLGSFPEQTLAECEACGHLQIESAGSACLSCSNTVLLATGVQRALIRMALLTDAEILVSEKFDGVAGLLRY